jgi:hypothetical protein
MEMNRCNGTIVNCLLLLSLASLVAGCQSFPLRESIQQGKTAGKSGKGSVL